ncbi:MAG: hypothetical protein QOG57_4998, partial [Pseudonocardiales bacterium]|nr:hypothetical protein [Pseudonocardiales bacterium]
RVMSILIFAIKNVPPAASARPTTAGQRAPIRS